MKDTKQLFTDYSEMSFKKMTPDSLKSTGTNRLKAKEKFYKDAVVLLENGIREIKIPDELVDDMITIFNSQANKAKSMLAYTNYLASKPDEDDPRL